MILWLGSRSQNFQLDFINEVGALKEEDRKGLVAAEFVVGELGEGLQFDLRHAVEELMKFIVIIAMHLGGRFVIS
jgi:hypothetical protein